MGDQLQEDLRSLLKQPWGRRIAYSIVFEFGLLAHPPRAIGDSPNEALKSARFDGVREFATTFVGHLQKANRKAYALLLKEHASRMLAHSVETEND